MSKGIRYLSGILALAATFMLCSCQPGEKTTKATTKGSDVTTSSRTTTNKNTTTKKSTTTRATTTRRTTTARRTTTQATTTQQLVNGKTLNVYSWNDEFRARVCQYYHEGNKGVENIAANIDLLPDGTKISWHFVSTYNDEYQTALHAAMPDGYVDLFMYESEYSYKYVNGKYSSYVASMDEIGLDQSKQYQYTKDIVTDKNGKIKGTSWQACPGMIAFNTNGVCATLGYNAATTSYMKEYLSTVQNMRQLGLTIEEIDPSYSILPGPEDLYRYYLSQIDTEMYNIEDKTITIGKQLFEYVNNAYEYAELGLLSGRNADYYFWGAQWAEGDKASSKVIAKYTTTWYNDFVFRGNCPAVWDGNILVQQSQPWRLISGFDNSFWGGTIVGVTESALEDDVKKDSITSLLTKMTTDKATMRAFSDGELDFANNTEAMSEKAEDTTVSDPFFGGQNTYAVADEASKLAKAPVFCESFLDITDDFRLAFVNYIARASEGGKASDCWAAFVADLKRTDSGLTIQPDQDVTIEDHITIKYDVQ